MVSLAITIILLAAQWRVYQKMGRQGWEGIIPYYNLYVLFEVLYGNGLRFLLLLIPFYNIYLLFKYSIDLAARFHKSSGFGIGLALLAPVFWCILGFGNDVYLDGSQATPSDDVISQAIDKACAAVLGTSSSTHK